jgi:hypothetical protein
MTTYWILWIFNALIALIPIYFFFVGLGDGSISSRNLGIWLILMLVVAVVLVGPFLLKAAHQMGLAKGLMIVAAIPGILVVLYFIVVMTMNPDWK